MDKKRCLVLDPTIGSDRFFFECLFIAIRDDPEREYERIEDTIGLVSQKATGAKGPKDEFGPRGMIAGLPSKSNQKHCPNQIAGAYRWRHRVETCFTNVKDFKATASRCVTTLIATASPLPSQRDNCFETAGKRKKGRTMKARPV